MSVDAPRVGQDVFAKLDDGSLWHGWVERFSEERKRGDRVEREMVIRLDPKRNVRMGKPNDGRRPSGWVRKLVQDCNVGDEYTSWQWRARMEIQHAEVEFR